jgi:catechol 2,3-dioxygenase-like lactoylglutathione lyase family enzyme
MTMRNLDYLVLAVKDAQKSGALYAKLFDATPIFDAPTFVMFGLGNGVKLGLWQIDEINPPPRPAGGVEISFTETDNAALEATFERCKALGLTILQAPTMMGFGYAFAAEDADGHRLRPFVPAVR